MKWKSITREEKIKIANKQELDKQKAQQKIYLENITVTVNEKVFKGNDLSINRMTNTIEDAKDEGATDESILVWKTVNGNMNVTIAELKQARKLALAEIERLIGVTDGEI